MLQIGQRKQGGSRAEGAEAQFSVLPPTMAEICHFLRAEAGRKQAEAGRKGEIQKKEAKKSAQARPLVRALARVASDVPNGDGKMVKAIETKYRGYRFRSRLEARWAVFFDALGLDWIYEPEGYHLSDGQLYLPDFEIRSTGMFVEVKGDFADQDEIRRCEMLADSTGKAVLLVSGLPMERRSHLFCWDVTDSSGGSYSGLVTFVWPASGQAEVIAHDDTRVDRDRDLFLKFFTENHVKARYSPIAAVPPDHMEAAAAARSARFEHGEKGAR